MSTATYEGEGTHGVVGPRNQCPTPFDAPNRTLAIVKDRLLVPQPALLVQHEDTSHPSRDKLARVGALGEAGLKGDTDEGPTKVKDRHLRREQREDGDLA